ncbi:MAG: glycosyltransferase family 39 protein [Capsulimonas sp.]|uniref:ArnT family glycosyltransferase n=1 Tax=Capsulimonas sp. TaxID=2494211 RepID=UPI0032632460
MTDNPEINRAAPFSMTRGLWAMLLGVMALFVVFAVAYSQVTPAAVAEQHNADENAHVLYVKTLASGHLPVFKKDGEDYEAHQPPLYYALATPAYLVTRGADPATQVRAMRFVSIVIGALIVLVAFFCTREILPRQPGAALAVAAFLALLPGFIAISASVTNDTLTMLVIGLGLFLTARLARWTQTEDVADKSKAIYQKSALIGLALGLGILTKTLAAPLFPTVIFAFLLLAYGKRITGQQAVVSVAIACGVGVAVALPWLMRNNALYGDPIASHLFQTAFNDTKYTMTADIMMRVFGGFDKYLIVVFQWAFASYWGGFDSMRAFWGMEPHKKAPNFANGPAAIYSLLAILCVASVIGLARGLKTIKGDAGAQALFGACAALTALTLVAFLQFNFTYFQAQGRYWYPAIYPLTLFFVVGWRGLLANAQARRGAYVFAAVAMVGLNIFTIVSLLAPRFAGG